MTEAITLDANQIFDEIVARGKAELIVHKEAYDSLVEEVIEAHIDLGELNVDDDTEGWETQLKDRWDEYQARIAE